MTELVLVDGTYELFRAYYGAPSRTAADGREVGATLSCARSLWSLLNDARFGYMAVAFDTVIESFRNDLFDGYKTGEGIDPDLFAQFPLIEQLTAALGIQVLSMTDFEADDGLAAAADRFAQDDRISRIVIASPDKDLSQCVTGERIVLWDRLRKSTYDESAVLKKRGVPTRSIPDFLALVGDTADGIPGVPRWGEKSAARVLARYGHLEEIPRDAARWDIRVRGAAALVEQLRDHEEEALLYRTLATLRTDAPVPGRLEDYRPREPDRPALLRLGQEFGAGWLTRIPEGL